MITRQMSVFFNSDFHNKTTEYDQVQNCLVDTLDSTYEKSDIVTLLDNSIPTHIETYTNAKKFQSGFVREIELSNNFENPVKLIRKLSQPKCYIQAKHQQMIQ